MQSIGIVTDSIACIPEGLIEQHGIKVVPINILFEDKVYQDGIDLTPAQAYEFLRKDPDRFTTSPASPGRYLEAFHEVSRRANQIFCITLSSGLSTLYNMAEVAREEARQELPHTQIEVLDSQTAAGAEGLIVLAAARAVAEGKPLAEVVKITEEVKGNTTMFGLLDTIRHVYRTGRIPKIASQLGSLLSLKPLITIRDRTIHIAGLARSKQRGVEQLLEMMRKKAASKPLRVFLSHADVPEEAEKLKERILAEFNCVELLFTYFSPVMGYATGRGTLVVGFHPEI